VVRTLSPPRAGTGRQPLPSWEDQPPPHETSTFPAHEALWATLLLVAVTCGALAGFTRMFVGGQWAESVFAAALTGHALGWALRRARLPTAPAVAVGLAAVAVVGVWVVAAPATTDGLPLGAAWSSALSELADSVRLAPSINPPLPELPGFQLLAGWGAGLVAVLADWAAFRLRATTQAVLPAAAALVTSSVLGRPSGRVVALLAFLVPAAAFLVVQRNTVGRTGTVWAGGRARPAVPWRSGLVVAAGAVAAALLVVPVLAPTDGHGALGWRHGPGNGADGARSVISPIVDLHTRLVNEPGVPVMTVSSPEPSYWRLTSLDTFTGEQWQSTNSYYPAGSHLPGVGPPPPDTRQVVERFHIQGLSSIWLPAAFDPEAITGGGKVTWDPVSGSLLTARPTADGLDYQVTSLQELATLDPQALEAAGAPPTGGAFAEDLQLPPLDPEVKALAEHITAGARTEYDKAIALQNWFHGPLFQYSLDPPSDGYGAEALTTFLFETRIGYCQQFAGAYAVLARSIGLPTRLAVGFTTGAATGPDRYQVTDADAHTWPEVLFPRYGWLPFEPTKGGFQVPGTSSYAGDTTGGPGGGSPSAPATTTPGTGPATAPSAGSAGGTGGAGQAARAHAVSGTPRAVEHPSGWAWWWLPIGLGIAACGFVGAVLVLRRRHHRARRRAAPGDRVVTCWEDVEALLAWSGVRRRSDETAVELARRAVMTLSPWTMAERSGATGDDALGSLGELARLASAASWSGEDLDAGEAADAEARRDRLGRFLLGANPWHRRLRWWSDPRLGLLR
jgi:transglutaminase-like putative cysteine protease